ncbi:hypothetical protein [Dongia deserti]|uniref:hypothetical protein n=1 Tax=Dongia deserti TaxID=2268030 RepID=UPI000E64ECDC|nr:hypothetical protein [Dongia deserti]
MRAWGKYTRRLLASLALVAATVVGGCLAESEHPIAAADPEKNDARLWGSWILEEEDEYLIAHVFATEDDKLRISLADHGVEGLGDVETYDVHVTRLPSGDYLNVMSSETEDGYVFIKYEFEGTDHLSVWSMENEKLVQAVKDGTLAGTTKQDGSGIDVRITATSEQWQAFLAKAPVEFFGEPSTFRRIGPAYVEQQ